MEFVGGDYVMLAEKAKAAMTPYLDTSLGVQYPPSLIVRNATWFPPIQAQVPTISLLQDIIEGPQREMQEAVIKSSAAVVFNSEFTRSKYPTAIAKTGDVPRTIDAPPDVRYRVIPLPVDFSLFEPQNPMGCQQALSLPDGCVCWIGASQGAAGQVKGFDIFLRIVRTNPDIPFVAVFKDALPEYSPPNLKMYCRLTHAELVKVIGACRVGLCTSRTESQHLAGVEMGACGLPMVAPPVGVYWQHRLMPEVNPVDGGVPEYSIALRATLKWPGDPQTIRAYWQKEFDKPVIKAAWTKLIEEVECAR